VLRPYQSAAVNAALAFLRTSTSPALIDAAPAAGKSHMIAAVADALHSVSGGKKVLVLAPNAELVKQNHEKMLLTGHKASIFSASAGVKSTRHHIVFATPGTVKNAISRFLQGYCAVIVDEAHGMTPTICAIIDAMREANPNLRVLGLTGTPFNLGKGYIFRQWPDGRVNNDETTRDPYFTKCVYRVSAREMLDAGYITPMTIGAIHQEAYDTSGIVLLPNGMPNPTQVERAFVGHGRKTAGIVADVLEQARNRSGGVMLFAATVQHAQEVMASLPPDNSVMVTGDMEASARRRAIKRYRNQQVRYIVSVGTLTTGFDVTHTEVIAVLRYTESASLLTQILGRAWRLHEGKATSLLLDYAGNVERHFPDGDIYNPQIKAGKAPGEGGAIEAVCPSCGHENAFTVNKDTLDYKLDAHGYCLDTWGVRIETDFGPLPGHHGRRCNGLVKAGRIWDRCNYRWTSKPCPACEELNDIAARRCHACKAEIVDPNEKLAGEFKAMKRDPTTPQTDEVLEFTQRESLSQKGNRTIRADWRTPWRQFSTWHLPDAAHRKAVLDWQRFDAATCKGTPATVSYVKEPESGFYRILAFNQEADHAP
jgi:DNA repair protein RadD